MELNLDSGQMFSALLELQIKNLAFNQAIAAFLCEKMGANQEESEILLKDLIADVNLKAQNILEDLYARRHTINLDDILGK